MTDDNIDAPTSFSEETAAKNLGMTKGGLGETLDAVAAVSPELGEFLKSLFGGPIGITLAVSHAAYSVENERLDAQDKVWDQLAEVLAKPMGASIDDYNKHIADGRQAVANLHASLSHAGDDPDPIGTRFKKIRAFADAFIEGVISELKAQGGLEEATLLGQNATPQQMVAARQQTRAKIKSLEGLKKFFDGSGLLMVEQSVRRDAQPQLNADSDTAVLAQQQATAKNQDLQKEIQNLKNATGKGELAGQDPAFIADQQQIAEAEENLQKAREYKESGMERDRRDGHSPAILKEIEKSYDDAIATAQHEVELVKRLVQQKPERLSKLETRDDTAIRQQADATAVTQGITEEARGNLHRIDELPGDIADAQLKERMEQFSNAQVAATDAQTDKTLASLPPSVFGGAGAAGGRRLDPDRLNDILSGLILEQDALKKSLLEYQKKQAQMEQEIQDLQQGHALHTGQIRSANSSRL